MKPVPLEFFSAQHGIDAALLQRVLAEALGRGGDFADVYVEFRQSTSLLLEESLLKGSSESVSLGAGVRVIAGEQTGYAYTNELSLPKLLEAARTAAAIATGAGRSGSVELVARVLPSRYATEQPATQAEITGKMNFLRAADQAARAADARVREVRANWSDEQRQVLIANSEGQLVGDVQPLFTFGLSVVAEENGNRQSGSKNLGLRAGLEAFSVEDAQQLAREAVAQAAVLLTAEDAPAGELPVVLAPGASGVLLHESVGHPLEADANRKKLSVFSDRLGEKIATELCTVVDDATLPGLRGSLNVDGEGTVPQEPTVLIERGVLRGYLQDRLSARLMKMSPTGNGRRESYEHLPMPRMTNTFMLAGPHDPEEIIASVDKGLYAVNFGGGQVDITSGKFVFSASEAYLIEGGKVGPAVKGATLIGNGPDALTRVRMVGNDMRLDPGVGTCGKDGQSVPVGVGQPTLLIGSLTVGGTEA